MVPRRTAALTLLLACAAPACAPASAPAGGAPPAVTAAPVAFTATMDTVFGVEGELRGEAERRGDTLFVRVDAARLSEPGTSASPFGNSDSVRVAVASGSPEGRWRLGAESPPRPAATLLASGGGALPAPVEFRIPLPRGADLRGRWLVFSFARAGGRTLSGEAVTGYSYAHTPPGLFERR